MLRAERDEARGALKAAQQALLDEKERQMMLRAELQHGVRNMIAVIRSIFARSVEAGGNVQHLSDHFHGRLDVLARYQLIRTRDWGAPPDLELLIRDEFVSALAGDDPRVIIDGPGVRVPHESAQFIGLAFHELFTNSIKFGILSHPPVSGRIHIAWSTHDEALTIEWRETGLAGPTPASRRSGFGRTLIEEALPYQLGARTTFDLTHGHLACTMAIPLPRLEPAMVPLS